MRQKVNGTLCLIALAITIHKRNSLVQNLFFITYFLENLLWKKVSKVIMRAFEVNL